MAKYVYRCVDCKAEKDVEHSIKEDPDIFCGECDGLCTRVPQPIGTVLKGKGFYRNDKNFNTKDDTGTTWGEA